MRGIVIDRSGLHTGGSASFVAADRCGSFEGHPSQVDPDVWEHPRRLGDDALEPPAYLPTTVRKSLCATTKGALSSH
jgi:hypothetical protein